MGGGFDFWVLDALGDVVGLGLDGGDDVVGLDVVEGLGAWVVEGAGAWVVGGAGAGGGGGGGVYGG